jgi:hypothetical protein
MNADFAARHYGQPVTSQNPLECYANNRSSEGRTNTQPGTSAKRVVRIRTRPQVDPSLGQKPFRLWIEFSQVVNDQWREDNSSSSRQLKRAKLNRFGRHSL